MAIVQRLLAPADPLLLCRLANAVAPDTHKLPFRGTISSGSAKIEQTRMGNSPPVWFVFCGALFCTAATQPFQDWLNTDVESRLAGMHC